MPEELHEAAQGRRRERLAALLADHVPLMKPAILVALLFRTLDAFRIFDSVFIISNGNNPNIETVSVLGYNQLLNRLNLGLGSAISVLIFLCVVLIAFLFVKGFGTSLAAAARGGADEPRRRRVGRLDRRRRRSSSSSRCSRSSGSLMLSLKSPVDGHRRPADPVEVVHRELQRDLPAGIFTARADQLDRHRADLDGHRGDRSPRWPPTRSRGWTSRARR